MKAWKLGWNLDARVVLGAKGNPVIAAMHGAGQRIRSNWWNWLPGDFWAMSGLAEECRRRNWTLWMPQADHRLWMPWQMVDWEGMREACAADTGLEQMPYVFGFSHGGTAAATMLYMGAPFPGFAIYSGVEPKWLKCKPHPGSKVLIVKNADERHPLIPWRSERQLTEESLRMHRRLTAEDTEPKAEMMTTNSTVHEWDRKANEEIFDKVTAALRDS